MKIKIITIMVMLLIFAQVACCGEKSIDDYIKNELEKYNKNQDKIKEQMLQNKIIPVIVEVDSENQSLYNKITSALKKRLRTFKDIKVVDSIDNAMCRISVVAVENNTGVVAISIAYGYDEDLYARENTWKTINFVSHMVHLRGEARINDDFAEQVVANIDVTLFEMLRRIYLRY